VIKVALAKNPGSGATKNERQLPFTHGLGLQWKGNCLLSARRLAIPLIMYESKIVPDLQSFVASRKTAPAEPFRFLQHLVDCGDFKRP
jgi:hypothetical protein